MTSRTQAKVDEAVKQLGANATGYAVDGTDEQAVSATHDVTVRTLICAIARVHVHVFICMSVYERKHMGAQIRACYLLSCGFFTFLNCAAALGFLTACATAMLVCVRVTYACHVSDSSHTQVKALFDKVGPFDHLISSSGRGRDKPFLESTLAELRATWEPKYFLYLNVTRQGECAMQCRRS